MDAILKKPRKAAGKAAMKASKHISAVWGFHPFPGPPCDAGFLWPELALYLSAAREEGTFPPSTVSSGIQTRSGLFWYAPETNLDLFFSQDYLKILLYSLKNFDINYVSSALQLLLLKLRDPNQLCHFALSYPSFKTINVL